MEIDNEGDVYLLSFLCPGAFANGAYVVTDPGMTYHMLVYSRAGVFKKGYKMDIACPTKDGAFNQGFSKIKMALDKTRRKWYLAGGLAKGFTGEDSLTLGGTFAKGSCFLSRFDDAGKMEWLKENTWTTVNGSGISSRPLVDKYGSIYIGGTGSPNNIFNGYTFTNLAGHTLGFVMKLDSSGKTIWTKTNTTNAAAGTAVGLSMAGNVVGYNSQYVGKLGWDSYSFLWKVGGTFIPYFARFNSITGSILV